MEEMSVLFAVQEEWKQRQQQQKLEGGERENAEIMKNE